MKVKHRFLKTISISTLFLFLAIQLTAQNQTESFPLGPYWGDQGDGTYLNPVLFGNFPDTDVEKLGDTYYMISSTMHLSPGMLILSSQDLVNWAYEGYVFKELSWHSNYSPEKMAGYGFGTWAGDLCKIDDRWYCYMIDWEVGLLVSSAPHPTGPWESPVLIKEMKNVSDPAAYFDEKSGEAYLILNSGKVESDTDRFDPQSNLYLNEQRIFKLGKDRKSLADEGKVVYVGPRSEACKIYNIEGRWYILTVDWTESDQFELKDRKQICLRSLTNSIYGPYEKKVVLEQGNGIPNSACQGSLLQVDDGSWWYLHQLVQNGPNFWGRPQMLEPVKWVDGWPIIGKDIDNDGIGEPVYSGIMPIKGKNFNKLETNDFFDEPTLSPQWNWTMDPDNDRWSLTDKPGFLRLYTGKTVNNGGFWNASNTISQRILGNGKGVATAEISLEGIKKHQIAGLCRFSMDFSVLGAAIKNGNKRIRLIIGNDTIWGPVIDSDKIWVRTTNLGSKATFSYSLDGNTWSDIGSEYTYKAGFRKWMGDRIGFCSYSDKKDNGYLDVGWFLYEYTQVQKK